MFFRKVFWLFPIMLLFGAFIATRGQNQHQDAYTQGYIAGQQSVLGGAEGTTAVAPDPQPVTPTPHPGDGFFSGLFKTFAFFFGFMFLIGTLAMLFGGKHRHHHGRYKHDWHKEWKHHGRQPKWDDDLKDEPIMKA